MKSFLTPTRKKILVFWYQYHVETNLWPTFDKAAKNLGMSKPGIHYSIKRLIEEEWMVKDDGDRGAIALTKYGEGKIFEASLIASGQKKKEIKKSEMLVNKIKKP